MSFALLAEHQKGSLQHTSSSGLKLYVGMTMTLEKQYW
jgi:hypothetical protein